MKCQILIFVGLFLKSYLRTSMYDINVDAKTETAASSENSGRKSTENEQKRKRSIVILEDDEIEEFQSKQVAKNTVKGTESAVRRLEAWYNDRYGEKLVLSSINKTNASDLLKHFCLEIRDTRKDSLGEEYEPSTLSSLQQYGHYRKCFHFESTTVLRKFV